MNLAKNLTKCSYGDYPCNLFVGCILTLILASDMMDVMLLGFLILEQGGHADDNSLLTTDY